jgi:hypothetical protein
MELEIAVLPYELAVLPLQAGRPELRPADRAFSLPRLPVRMNVMSLDAR